MTLPPDRPRCRVSVVQSSYIPWKGYFDLIDGADVFVLFDDAEFSKHSWRNRNRIKTPSGPRWLTIPVRYAGHSHDAIKDIVIADAAWGQRHWDAIYASYREAPYFRELRPYFEPLFRECRDTRLSDINYRFLTAICSLLGITTRLCWSMEFRLCEGRNERLVDLCTQLGASEYISGPSAKGYLDESLFRTAGIEVSFMSYEGYPEYPQFFPPFEHAVSMLDVLFQTGRNATDHLLTRRGR